jgi:hypothetical protein
MCQLPWNIIGWVTIDDVSSLITHELLYLLAVSGVTNQQAMLAELPNLPCLYFCHFCFLECLFKIEVVIDHVDIVKHGLQVRIVKSNLQQHVHIHFFQEILVP